MDSTRPLPNTITTSSAPTLPPSAARPAPMFERRAVEVTIMRPPERHTSMRTYLFVALGLAATSVAGWFALGEYIYG